MSLFHIQIKYGMKKERIEKKKITNLYSDAEERTRAKAKVNKTC